jgi:hypothetical protein
VWELGRLGRLLDYRGEKSPELLLHDHHYAPPCTTCILWLRFDSSKSVSNLGLEVSFASVRDTLSIFRLGPWVIVFRAKVDSSGHAALEIGDSCMY